MEKTEPIMSAGEGIEVTLVRIEGKLDRMGDRMAHYERDIDGIRSRVHDLNNTVTPLVMLGLPDRIRVADTRNAEVDARISALEVVEQQRKGAASLVKVLWGLFGAAGIGGVAAVLRILQVGGF